MTLATAVQTLEDTERLFEVVDFQPWPEQAEIIYCDARYIIVTGGEQGGKSLTTSKLFLKRWPEDMATRWDGDRALLYWLVGSDYANTEEEFNYIRDDFVQIFGVGAVRASKRVDPGYIEITMPDENKPRIRVETKSAKDPRRLARTAPNGIMACEASQLDITSFHRIDGRTAPRRGWMVLSGTLEGSMGWYPSVAEAWKNDRGERRGFELPSWVNRSLYPGGRNDPEILRMEQDKPDEFFMERIAGKRVPPAGLVHGEFRPDIHVQELEYVVGEPVTIWTDPGYSGAYACEVSQEINGQIHVFDEIYQTGLITSEIIDIAKQRPWYRDFSNHVIDVAGWQHQAMAAPAEIWLSETGVYPTSQKVMIPEGIERLKSFLKVNPTNNLPKIVFSPKCEGILSEFGARTCPLPEYIGQDRPYRWKTDREGNIVGTTPEDKFNHGIKAVTYGIVDRYGFATSKNRNKIPVRRFGRR